jgi:hypothetical protein
MNKGKVFNVGNPQRKPEQTSRAGHDPPGLNKRRAYGPCMHEMW